MAIGDEFMIYDRKRLIIGSLSLFFLLITALAIYFSFFYHKLSDEDTFFFFFYNSVQKELYSDNDEIEKDESTQVEDQNSNDTFVKDEISDLEIKSSTSKIPDSESSNKVSNDQIKQNISSDQPSQNNTKNNDGKTDTNKDEKNINTSSNSNNNINKSKEWSDSEITSYVRKVITDFRLDFKTLKACENEGEQWKNELGWGYRCVHLPIPDSNIDASMLILFTKDIFCDGNWTGSHDYNYKNGKIGNVAYLRKLGFQCDNIYGNIY